MKKNDRRKRKLQEEACDYEIERTPTTRYEPDYEEGLTSAQAEEHRRDGWGNISVDPPAQTTEEIIKENVFTYFNLIFLVLAILLIIVGSFRNLTFLPVIIFNTLIGIIQEIRSKKTLEKLNMLNAPHATVIRDGKTSRVNSESLVLDDIVIFKAGNQVCADAEVVHGSVQVNESLLTGESDEITKNPGDHLMSGSFIVAGECHARLDAVGVDSYISKLTLEAKAMQKGEQSEMIRSLDKLVKFVGIALIPIGIILFVQSFFFNGDPFRSSITSMVAAVIGMIPEGLYLLASVAMAVSAMRLAKQKVLLHDMKSIETLARVNVLCVDKTGTITSGEPKVTDIIPAEGVSEEELLQMAFALEKKSEHPLARAILALAEEKGLAREEVSDFSALPGNGLVAKRNGKELCGGNRALITKKAVLSKQMEEQAAKLSEEGKTPLFFSEDGKMLGMIAVADVIKEDSPRAVKELQNMGIRVVMLTGDNERTARAIGAQAGVDEVIAGVLPDGKEAVISRLKEKGKVAMVGDGINDAPALTSADIGIAIGAGTDIAIDAADVVLMKSRLSDVPAAIRLSRATLRNIHENLFWAFIYNIIGIPLAAGVWIPLFGWKLNPMFGAAAMSFSSLCVVTNALRLNLFRMHDASKDKRIKNEIPKEDLNMTTEQGMVKTMTIEGMMCGHCEARVKKTLEAIEGVASAEVSHEKGTAVVTLTAPVSDDVLKTAVEAQDYTVKGIQ